MKIYRNPYVSRECYFVRTGPARSHKGEASKSQGYEVTFWDGKWIVGKAQYYDYSLRDELPVIAENKVSIQSVVDNAILLAVLDLVNSAKVAENISIADLEGTECCPDFGEREKDDT